MHSDQNVRLPDAEVRLLMLQFQEIRKLSLFDSTVKTIAG